MNFEITFIGQFIIVFALIVSSLCYFLGKQKTTNPMLAAAVGFLLSLFPIFGLIYLAYLAIKKDVISP